jgi:hypothetical protein
MLHLNNQPKTSHLFYFQFGRRLQVEADLRGRVRFGGRDQGLRPGQVSRGLESPLPMPRLELFYEKLFIYTHFISCRSIGKTKIC